MDTGKRIEDLKPEHVRMAFHSAAGKGIKFPSAEFEEYVATYLNRLRTS